MNENEIKKILDCENPSEFVEIAKKKSKHWKYTARQIRNIYESVLKIEDPKDKELFLLKPKLEYLQKRNSKNLGRVLVKDMSDLIDNINVKDSNKRFGNFKDFFEAIIAYAKQS